MTKTRCKFRCTEIVPANPHAPESIAKRVTLTTHYDNTIAEDQAFTRYTPWGTFTAQIDNPAVLPMFEVGKTYYLDITPAE